MVVVRSLSPSRHALWPRCKRPGAHGWAATVLAALLCCAGAGQAKGRSAGSPKGQALWAPPAPDDVRIDGVAKEWTNTWRATDYTLSGSRSGPSDADARVVLATDKDNIYVGAEVRDDRVVPDADHLELLIGFSGGSLRSVKLYPGVAGKSRARAIAGGGAVRGAKVVEAPAADGYSLEAQIPWSTFPDAKTARVGMRGAVLLHDADQGKQAHVVLATAGARDWAGLPAIMIDPEIGLATGLLTQQRIRTEPAFNLIGNVFGDAMKERVLIYGRYLVVLGPSYRSGAEYFFREIGVDASTGGLPRCDLQDLTGDGLADLVLRKSFSQGGYTVELLEVLSYATGGDSPERIFAHEVSWRTPQGTIAGTAKITGNRIVLESGGANGASAKAFRPPFKTDAEPMLFPWGPVSSRTFQLREGRATKVTETASGGGATQPAQPSTAPAHAGSGGGDEVPANMEQRLAKVYEQYQRERGVSGAPRFKVTANLVGDAAAERAVVHDRDLVVFGPGFRDGAGYAVVTLAPFATSRDIASLRAQDVTGTGKSSLLVEGSMRAQAPADAGGGEVVRRVLLVYALDKSSLRRVFAAELERSIGSNKVVGGIELGRGQIVLRPGKAVGFTEQTYPFAQDVGSAGGFEPLLLPWSGAKPVRYTYDGERFAP